MPDTILCSIEAKVRFINLMQRLNPENPEIDYMITEIGHLLKIKGNYYERTR